MNIQELANVRITVSAFTQYLTDRGLKVVQVLNDGTLKELDPIVVELVQKNFYDKVIDSVVKMHDCSNTSL